VPTKKELPVYVRRKGHHYGGRDYHQLVESLRVNGKPRQRVVLHLGGHATVDEALKVWPEEIASMQRQRNEKSAGVLRSKLDRLRELRSEGKA
jgi:hypothetical protein